jgi:hypothetical protein
MSRPKGLPKTGGRKKGTPNRSTSELKDLLASCDYEPATQLIRKYPELTISEQVKVDIKLLEFLYPRPKVQVEPTPLPDEDSEDANLTTEPDSELKNRSQEIMRRLLVAKKNYAEDLLELIQSVRPDLFK